MKTKLILAVMVVALSGCALVRTPVRVAADMAHMTVDLATAPF
ncbi:hypothetical protein SAMN04488012_101290 [Palleronia salina]|uniref:Uncharacterized protein n=2 Tax=Palleronia TaxID=315422 RepID=A0A1M6AXD8_9RHOB|nr:MULTISPECIES: hypothetical protein [Palleronia]SEM85341.1 hypothetical protein SAMN04488011_101695 [Palleronia pelagia]SHI41209.1 hypothetical protein SAMN04488012_101290 [Palleronia salina]